VAHIRLEISEGWHHSTLRHWVSALWSRLDRLTTWYIIWNGGVMLSWLSTPPIWLHSSSQVSASVFTTSNMQLHHLCCHSDATNGLRLLYMPRNIQKRNYSEHEANLFLQNVGIY
jgi:hypothetical protein